MTPEGPANGGLGSLPTAASQNVAPQQGGGGNMTPANPNAGSGYQQQMLNVANQYQKQGIGDPVSPEPGGAMTGQANQGGSLGGGGLAGIMKMMQQFHPQQGTSGGMTNFANVIDGSGNGTATSLPPTSGGMTGGADALTQLMNQQIARHDPVGNSTYTPSGQNGTPVMGATPMQGGGGLAGLMQMIQQFRQQQGNSMNGGGSGMPLEQQMTQPGQGGERAAGGMRGGDGTSGPGQAQGQGGQSGQFNFGQLLQQLMQQRQGGASPGGYGQQQGFQQTPQMGGGGYSSSQPQQPSGGQYWNYHPQAPTNAPGQAPSQGAGGAPHGAGSMVGGHFQPLPTGSGGSLYGMPEYGNSGVYSRSEGPDNTWFYNGNNKQWGDESNGAFQNQFGGKQGG